MKIAFFHEVQPGGAKRAVLEFGRELKKNHQVDLYYTDSKRDDEVGHIFNHVFYFHFSQKNWIGNNWKMKLYKDTIELFQLYSLHRRISRRINNQHYDVVLLSPSRYTQAPFLLRFLTSKKIYYCQEALRMIYEKDFAIPNSWRFSRKIYEQINRRIRKEIDQSNIRHSDFLIANSKFSQQNIVKAYGKKSIVCYMGVDTELFTPSLQKKEYDILYVGAFDPVDGYDFFKDSTRLINRKIVVKELLREKQWIKSPRDMMRLYQKAKLVVCISRNEPFGLIPLEAMSCGVPVIAVNEGGYRESVVDRKTGYLVERDPYKLAKKIRTLLEDKQLYRRLSLQAREMVEKDWSWSTAADNLESVMLNVISNPPKSHAD